MGGGTQKRCPPVLDVGTRLIITTDKCTKHWTQVSLCWVEDQQSETHHTQYSLESPSNILCLPEMSP